MHNGMMTKGELRKLRQSVGKLNPFETSKSITRKIKSVKRYNKATRAEQQARYIDCGPANWDDRNDY